MHHLNFSTILPLAIIALASLASSCGTKAVYADTMVTIFKNDSTPQGNTTAPQMQLKNAVISMEVSFTVTENIDDATCRLNFTLVGPAQFYNSSDPRYWGVSFTQNTYFEFGLYPLLGSTVFIRCISKANGVMVNVSVKNGEVPCKPGLNQFLLAPYGRNQFIFYWEESQSLGQGIQYLITMLNEVGL
ncbi:MAG: hypothetical protein FRX48_06161 [Lasallia pustulata]|uniref:Ubiquitin 3 binding protein But2 C-terminal domain-containing protein n=1 Tax=Lasallia pustulata TaxID=136370 RepID=A0A5M8PKH7_9LECA|nr:MAG: hypothetical protein FRX48_06161 [Lasallia pustulata]